MRKMSLTVVAACPSIAAGAQESRPETDDAADPQTAAATEQWPEPEKLSGREKKRLPDETVAALVDEYNESIDDDKDKLAFKR